MQQNREEYTMSAKDPNRFYSIAMICLILSGLATALMSKETVRVTLKNLGAGLCAGSVVVIIGNALGFSEGIILLASNIMTAFATKFWPLTGDIFEKWAKKKLTRLLGIDDPPSNNNNNTGNDN